MNVTHGYHTKVEKQVDECVDEIVAQLVDAHIGKYVPKSLRESIDRQRTELDSAHTQLHNVLRILHMHTTIQPDTRLWLPGGPDNKTRQSRRGSTSVNPSTIFWAKTPQKASPSQSLSTNY